MPWKGGIVAINSFGFGGANAHVILRSNPKPKVIPTLESPVPKIIAVSGRTESAVHTYLDKIKQHENDDDLLAMVREIHARNVTGHSYRGYQILGCEDTIREVEEVQAEKRPIWCVVELKLK